MYMNHLPMAKLVVQAVAGLGVSKILGDIIKNNVTISTTYEKVLVKTGTFVLGSMLVDQSSKHISDAADTVVAMIEDRRTTETETASE